MKLLVSFLVLALSITGTVILPKKVSAISDNILIYQVQTGGDGSGTAKQEIVLLYNASSEDVNITNWCIEYRSASYSLGFTQCIESNEKNIEIWVLAGGMVSFATTEFVDANPGFIADSVMVGGMSSTSGHVVLIDSLNEEVDKLGWGEAISPEGESSVIHQSGEVLGRNLATGPIDTDVNVNDFSSSPLQLTIISGVYEVEVQIDLCSNIDGLQIETPEGYLTDEKGDCYEDFCPNLEGLQIVAPAGYERPQGFDNCEEMPLEDRVLFITELLPNPPSYDTDAEFIELFNPNSSQINLAGYKLQVGPSFAKEFEFKDGYILPGEYLVFNDGITGITLPNSSGVSIRLVAPAGNVVSQTEVYTSAGDDVSWALVDDQWIFTNQITPDKPNKPYLEAVVDEVEGVTTVFAPCPEGKYRNPETNRCKTIETAVSQLTPCDEDEYRNPETNRCRKISSSSSSLAPCEEGEERNPETNRCRKVSVLGISDERQLPTVTDIPAVATTGSINWGIIGVALVGTFGYILYEWRSEILRLLKIT